MPMNMWWRDGQGQDWHLFPKEKDNMVDLVSARVSLLMCNRAVECYVIDYLLLIVSILISFGNNLEKLKLKFDQK